MFAGKYISLRYLAQFQNLQQHMQIINNGHTGTQLKYRLFSSIAATRA